MSMKEGTICNFDYAKSPEDTSKRTIIPTSIPATVIRGIDVTEVEESQRERLLEMWSEYQSYRKQQMSNIFSFDHFIEQTHPGEQVTLKWRSFDINKIQHS